MRRTVMEVMAVAAWVLWPAERHSVQVAPKKGSPRLPVQAVADGCGVEVGCAAGALRAVVGADVSSWVRRADGDRNGLLSAEELLEVIIGESHAELKHVIKMAAGASPPPPPAPPPAITAPRTPSAGGLVPVPEPVSKRTRARSAAAEAEAAAFRLVISAWQRRLRLARAMVVPIPRSAPGNSDDQADGDDDETEKHYEERCGGHVDARFGPANCSSLPLPVVHGQLLRLLRRLKAAAAEAGVPVWLDSGTLLGAWREGRIIAHDDDADVGMMRADIRRLPAIDTADMLLDINPHHVHADEDGDMLNMVDARLICKRTGVFVDVFGFSERMGVRDVLHTKYEGSMPGARDGSVELPWVATHELFPLQGCWLDGVRFQCPRNPYAVLTRYYGWDLSPLSPSELPERTTSS